MDRLLSRLRRGWLRWRRFASPRRLRELERRYRAFGGAATRDPVWTPELVHAIDFARFRADGPYVWQKALPNLDEAAVRAAYEHLHRNDPFGLLARLGEDGAFGAGVLRIDGRAVSRDLLDAVAELGFLERHLGLSGRAGFRVLDVGAGYGRLAHRAVAAFPDIVWASTDAISVSTFLAERYLAFRAAGERAPVIALDEVEEALARHRFDLAVNVHSFSECTHEAIDWWLELLSRGGVERLFLVPNAVSPDGRDPLDNRGRELTPLLERHRYRPETVEPKYTDPELQRIGLSPTAYFLYRLESRPG